MRGGRGSNPAAKFAPHRACLEGSLNVSSAENLAAIAVGRLQISQPRDCPSKSAQTRGNRNHGSRPDGGVARCRTRPPRSSARTCTMRPILRAAISSIVTCCRKSPTRPAACSWSSAYTKELQSIEWPILGRMFAGTDLIRSQDCRGLDARLTKGGLRYRRNIAARAQQRDPDKGVF